MRTAHRILTIGACIFPMIAQGQTIQLFNGENLDGFYTFLKDRGRDTDPKHVFTVNDGMIRISGEEWGCITTDDEFENYHLVVEFKWGDQAFEPRVDNARDNGVLLHSTGPDGAYGGIWMHSIECQIIEGGTGDIIVVSDGSEAYAVTCPVAEEMQGSCHVFAPDGEAVTVNSGRINWWGRDPGWEDVINFRGAQDVEKPVGEWNRLECFTRGGAITIVLNGVVVNRATSAKPTKGRIQVQSEGAEMFVRKVALTPLEPIATRSDYRMIYNCDGDNMFIYVDPPMKPADLYPYIDAVAESGITSFFMSPNIGMTVCYPSDVSDFIGQHASPELAARISNDATHKTTERGIANLRGLIEQGLDPIQLVVDRAREKGMEVFLSWRLNEVHAVEQDDHLIFSRFWREHPEWRMGKAGDAMPQVYHDILGPDTHPIVASWLPAGLNFAVPEMRAHRLAQLREICIRYDIDGLDLDFQRFPMYFKPGEEAQHVATMTAWIRDVRAMTREVSDARGRPLQLCARIMAKPEQNVAIGLDPITWAQEGLVDFLVVSHYLRNDFPLPVSEYRKLLPEGMPVYASIEVAPNTATYRDIGRYLWAEGADGILLFNFFTTRERGAEPPFHVIAELADPTALGAAPPQ
jgi:3-keto-disaccharide hydrolase